MILKISKVHFWDCGEYLTNETAHRLAISEEKFQWSFFIRKTYLNAFD